MRRIKCIPPAPEVMWNLYMDYRKIAHGSNMSFRQYLELIGYSNPAKDVNGMDDGSILHSDGSLELIDIPSQQVTGQLHVKVLLIDFEDRKGDLPLEHYEELLFSEDTYLTGSMRDYYKEVSLGNVEITGSVHGWFRMPEPYSFYTNYESGTKKKSYPRNSQRMAEDAVSKAIEYGVRFEPELDKLNQGIVTALFIIHAGRGAEVMPKNLRGREIWSHKWNLRNPVEINSNLFASTYLTVPHDCKIGVCAHELGHLAFQWQDFYDPNYDRDGKWWAGSGRWDVMANGSYNGKSATPAHPAGLHKSQHNWVTSETINSSCSITLPPYSPSTGKVIKIVSPVYKPGQYLLLENRIKQGFDSYLPGEGLLVWRVDEKAKMVSPDNPGLLLIQADQRHDLERPGDWNQGDAGDPFPGITGNNELGDTGDISTSFPGKTKSGISLTNIRRDPVTKTVTLNIKI